MKLIGIIAVILVLGLACPPVWLALIGALFYPCGPGDSSLYDLIRSGK